MNPVRDAIEHDLDMELVGPGPVRPGWETFHTDEILSPQDNPKQRYSAGVLFPQKAAIERADDAGTELIEDATPDAEPQGEAEERDRPVFENESHPPSDSDEVYDHNANEQEVNRANDFLPSAMGLTALIQVPEKLRVIISAARYEARAMPELGKQDAKQQWVPHHFRKAIKCELVLDSSQLLTKRTHEVPVDTGLEGSRLSMHIFSRSVGDKTQQGQRMVTLTLINRNQCGEGGSAKDEDCFFQCGFQVEAADGGECFLEYPDRPAMEIQGPEGANDEAMQEDQLLALLYRHRRAFAIGHGCAALWEDNEGGAVAWVRTDVLPRYEVFPILPEGQGLTLSMKTLADVKGDQNLALCRGLAKAYEQWIDKRRDEVAGPSFPAKHRHGAERQLKLCRECLRRIREGIDLLEEPQARQAFAWMNEAMLMQQIHYDISSDSKNRREILFAAETSSEKATPPGRGGRRRRKREDYERHPSKPFVCPDYTNPPGGKGLWRPFQLAFVLMNVRGIIEPASDDRALVDLIWFPTGGGKTEAYLALAAFTIFWRRLGNPRDGGTTVLMRYTLRLLTTQQFQRAASLICACELIRQRERRLNTPSAEPVSIGLWVGSSVTPNTHAEARRARKLLESDGEPNAFALLNCPWCGIKLGPVEMPRVWDSEEGRRSSRTFYVAGYCLKENDDGDGKRVVFECPDPGCAFHSGLPVHVVDEAIYAARPTLVVGTVDKFAMMPWKAEARALFGRNSGGMISPPALIIQDELHLIAGALGSMVGHYELTIDELTRHNGHPSKIVASTATICRARDQVRKLYNREVAVFPPQGLKAGESFFAREATDKAGRVYRGVMATAVGSHITAQVRALAALLQSPGTLSGKGFTADQIDPYWTLMIYFNSLRELGHAATLVHADIQERLFYLWKREDIGSLAKEGRPDPKRFVNASEELTSRVPGDQVAETLARLFERCSDDLNDKGRREHKALDVCLATNMIQVGLDVSRLGIMAVIGQPKMTSEYIQATSRVGRSGDGPGLVVTIFNSAKPRDRSHYEHFRSYHQSLYRWVEPTSVTPFSIPVRERALHAQIVALARYWAREHGQNELLDHADHPPTGDLAARIKTAIVERCRAVDAEEVAGLELYLDFVMKKWRQNTPRDYGGFHMDDESRLMYPAGAAPRAAWEHMAIKTPTSMRSVDASCAAEVLKQSALLDASNP